MLRKTITFGAPLVIMSVFYYLGILTLTAIDDNHFNIITVNSIFAGFLFTSLALILGLGNSKPIMFLERINEMDKIQFKITAGITCSIGSIGFALLGIYLKDIYFSIFAFFEAYFLIMTVVMFVFAAIDVKFVIKLLRNEIKKELPKQQLIDHALRKIK